MKVSPCLTAVLSGLPCNSCNQLYSGCMSENLLTRIVDLDSAVPNCSQSMRREYEYGLRMFLEILSNNTIRHTHTDKLDGG